MIHRRRWIWTSALVAALTILLLLSFATVPARTASPSPEATTHTGPGPSVGRNAIARERRSDDTPIPGEVGSWLSILRDQGHTMQPTATLQSAPLNPDWEAYLESHSQSQWGYGPLPMDLRHLNRRPTGLESIEQLPSRFNWRDSGRVSPVKRQTGCGTCWAFGTTSVLESAVLIGEDAEYDFSEQSVALCVDPSFAYYYDGVDDPCLEDDGFGGTGWLAAEVFIRKGAVLESCHPYDLEALKCDGSCPGCDACPPVKRVNGYRYVTGDQSATNLIKQAVYDHGPTVMSFYVSGDHWARDGENRLIYDYAACEEETGYANHLVSIVGWDDEVAHHESPGQGAWLVKNSHGTDFGNDGYFWLAYDTACMTEIAYLTYEDYDAGVELLYWDEAGFVHSWGYGDTSAWVTNVFTSPRDSMLTHVEFWTTDHNTAYTIRVHRDGDPTDGLDSQAASQTGTCAEAGYYSIALDSPVAVSSGQPFAIAAQMTTEVYSAPIAIEEAAFLPDFGPMAPRALSPRSEPDISPPIQRGVSFARHRAGDPWTDLADEGKNACLRARTQGYDSDMLIPPGSTWRYLDDGSDQGGAWTASDFDDSGWSSGPAELGYGDGDEATVVGFGPDAEDRHITTYFRRAFTVTAPSALRLRLLRDDGAVVYLNGTEVRRDNMPGGAIGNQTLASTCVEGSDEETFWEVDIGAEHLVSGSNVIAVEVHQCDPGSSDISFDLELSRSAARPGDVSLHDEEACVASGRAIRLTTQWYVDAAAYADDYLDALDLTVEVDGVRLSDVADHWGAVEACGDIDQDGDTDYVTRWAYPIGSLGDGAHTVDSHFSLAYPITDGFDFDGDGELDAFSGSWDTAVSLQVGGCVLFDEAHEEANTLSWERAQSLEPEHPDWVYFSALADALSDEFTLVRNPDEPLTEELLAGYDGLMLSVPKEELTPDELAAVERFMQDGGGVLALSSFAAWTINPLTEEKGITCDYHTIFELGGEGDFVVEDFAEHPAVEGVAAMVTNWSGSLEATSPAVGLAFTEEDVFRDLDGDVSYDPGEPTGPFTVAAAYESGAGRLAVVADNSFQDHGFEDRNNAPLVRALLRWLTGGEAFGAQITKSVAPVAQVSYGDALTYTVVISAAPGTEVALYDPLLGTTFDRFLVQPQGVEHADDAITGALTVLPTGQTTVSFVVEVDVPAVEGLRGSLTNKACVRPLGGTLPDCVWSNEVVNALSSPGSSWSCLPRYGEPEFILSTNETSAGGPEPFVTSGDFNGDGLEDVVITRLEFQTYDTWELDILLNDGHGNLVLATPSVFSGTVPAVQHPREVVVADFNGDRVDDIFVADHGYDADPFPGYPNTLVLSVPGGRLVDASANLPQQSDYTHSAAAGDIDRDGDNDLYLGQLWGQSWIDPQILINDGNGAFTVAEGRLHESLDLTENGYTRAEFVDVNNDGFPDLVVADAAHATPHTTQGSVVLMNDGLGRFTSLPIVLPAEPSAVPGAGTGTDIQPGDLNHDGYPDLLMAYTKYDPWYAGRYIQALINNHDGTFRDETAARLPQSDNDDAWIYEMWLRDIDRDGDRDLLARHLDWREPDSLLFLNYGSGHFSHHPMDFGVRYLYHTFLDLDGDGGHDLIYAESAPPQRVYAIRDLGCPVFLPLVCRDR